MQITEQKPEIPLRFWTVEEYRCMAEVGILQADEPVELKAGQIIKNTSPQGRPHAVTITLIRRLIDNLLGNRLLIWTQLPVQLSDRSEPEPDVAVTMPDELRYLSHHPTPSEIHLIIEVADTTLSKDCNLKARDALGLELWIIGC